MKGHIRNIPFDKPFGFIRSKTLDNIFLHRDDYYGDWQLLTQLVTKSDKPKVKFKLTEGLKGPRAEKCELISEEEYLNNED